jgi:uncharacterized protein YggT (Ycf19 family)
MSLDEKFAPVQTMFYDMVGNFFQKVASLFGYPKNPGMPTIPDLGNEIYARSRFLDRLPSHQTFWSTMQRPETWFEMIFGPVPKIEPVPRYMYESKEEGFYNFYIENYKNIYFLPDWFSEFLQVRLNICLDTTVLESIREVLFVGLVVYSQIIVLRIALSWFVSINPYIFPWCYLSAAVDWTEEILQGIIPSILGINITGSVFLGVLGIIADSLNHLVFTMPFLPSEGEESKLLINQQIKDVVIFHYLPVLWYRYPIPNEIRKFWYEERPDILDYMQKAYQDLNIQFLPDNIVEELNKQNYISNLTIHQQVLETTIPDFSSTEILSSTALLPMDHSFINLNCMSYLTEQFHSLFLTDIRI